MSPLPSEPPSRVVIDAVLPQVDGGRHPVKRVVGDSMEVEAHLVVDGHDRVAGVLAYRRRGAERFEETPLAALGNDRYAASFLLSELGRWQYTIEAWIDPFATLCFGLSRRREAGVEVTSDLVEAALLVAAAAKRARPSDARDAAELEGAAQILRNQGLDPLERAGVALGDRLAHLMARHPDRTACSRRTPPLEVIVDPPRARFSSWYEMFPRSAGADGRHGTFADVQERLPYIAKMGFDVLYFPPVHPIGRTHRKGPNNSLVAGPDDPGSPWAIGSSEGGHEAVHPQLGTEKEFVRLVERARELGIEIALDIAFQASPDHPWVTEHPEWFIHRGDGSIQYAENPPKKYEDVYPFDFLGPAWRSLWQALRRIFDVWIERGVRVFRIDNPHTKPLAFWEWCLADVKEHHPETVFLAEAFTRPKLMLGLAKAGFSHSYCYFTWRTGKEEIQQYFEELTATDLAEYLRPSLWPNTPDILPEHLQLGGRAMFQVRTVLAATLAANYGIYGPAFELMETAARPGTEEYQDSEKYQLRSWDLGGRDGMAPLLARLNQIRRENPALQDDRGLRFHPTDNDFVLCYSKHSIDRKNVIIVVVNLDPRHRHSAWLDLKLGELGLPHDQAFQVHELIGDARFLWRGARNYVELDPHVMPAQVFLVRQLARREQSFEYYL